MKIGQEAGVRIVLLEMNFGTITYCLWHPVRRSRKEPEWDYCHFILRYFFLSMIFSEINPVFNQAKFDSIVLILYHYSNTTWNSILGWLSPTASPFTSSDQPLSQTLHSPEGSIRCLLLPLAMPAKLCEGVCDESEWYCGHLWRVYTSTGTGAHQRTC